MKPYECYLNDFSNFTNVLRYQNHINVRLNFDNKFKTFKTLQMSIKFNNKNPANVYQFINLANVNESSKNHTSVNKSS